MHLAPVWAQRLVPLSRPISRMAAVKSGSDAKPFNSYLSSLRTTVFTEMTNLANQHQSVNLGQGFPDDEGPESMKRIVGEAVLDPNRHNQYPSMLGIPELRQAAARHSESYNGISVDWQTEALVTSGATEGLAAAFIGMINEGDEAVILDPMYDGYSSMCRRSGAKLIPLRLEAGGRIDHAQIRNAFSACTKFVLVNSPHNPTGAIVHSDDLAVIAEQCVKHNTYAVADEVYQHLLFDGNKHKSLRTYPGMRDRCVTIGSAGKTFSFTGWKVGWACGPAPMIAALAKAHSFLTFTVPANNQLAVAHGLDHEKAFYEGLGSGLQQKRDYLRQELSSLGFVVQPSHGTYFLMADFRALSPSSQPETDTDFAMRLTKEAGVTVIPVSAFCVAEPAPRHLVRFCFCKTDAKLQEAVKRLKAYFGQPEHSNGAAATNGHREQ